MSDLEGYRQSLRRVMSDLTHQSGACGDSNRVFKTVTAAAVELIRGAACADVMLIRGDQFKSLAPTAALVGELDAVQVQHRRGPCLEAAVSDAIIRVPDLTAETRWPEFTAAALAVGIRSVLTFQLSHHQGRAAALNIYGYAAGAFDVNDEAIGAMLATHAAIPLLAEQKAAAFDALLSDGEGPDDPFRPYRPSVLKT
jgi:hypothetical protein